MVANHDTADSKPSWTSPRPKIAESGRPGNHIGRMPVYFLVSATVALTTPVVVCGIPAGRLFALRQGIEAVADNKNTIVHSERSAAPTCPPLSLGSTYEAEMCYAPPTPPPPQPNP